MVRKIIVLNDQGLTLFRVKKQKRRRRSRHLKASKSPTPWRTGEVQGQVGSSCIACLDIQRSKPFFLDSFCFLAMSGGVADLANHQSGR